MSYWRRVITTRQNGLRPWPTKAWYGPAVPRRKDVPTERIDREAFIADWSKKRRAYLDQVVTAIRQSPQAAAVCFARFRIRCWSCGRPLRDETSKALGVGPECRSGMDPAALARY
ncbi:DUF6011 domain-containing protein, partial [Streptomyces sp. DT225]